MMVEQVVGLEFITQGAERATRDITEYSRGTQLASKTASDLTIRLNDKAKVLIKQARIYQENTRYIQKINQLFIENARASQEIVNAATGVTNSYKSAADSMDVFAAQIDRVQKANLEVAQSFGEAVREANTYEMANKSAADSADVFAAQIARVDKANLQSAQSFGEAVRAANTYELANKSAADSADVFARELQRSEQIMRDQARAFGEAVREANTYQTANKSAAASAEIFSRELRKQEAQASDTARAHQEHIRALYQSNLANKSAADSAEVFARAMQLEEAERIKLERVYNRTAAAARVYEHTVENLNRAEKLGVISASQKAAELARLEDAYLQVGRSTAHANTFINQFGDGVRVAGIKTNRFGLYAQQVGYQVGDFFVQIQSGTNAFVAFGQQATQLAGLLPGLAGAIVGISISVATMFLSAWSRTKQEAEDVSDSLDNLVSSLDASTSATERAMTPIKELREEYGRFAEAIQTAARLRAQAELSNAMRELEGATQQIGNELGAFRMALNDAGKALNDYNDIVSYVGDENINNASTVTEAWQNYEKMAKAASEAAEGLGLTSYQAGRLDNALQDLARARGIEDIAEAAANALNEIDAMFTSTQTIPPEVAKIIEALEKVATSAAAGAGSAIEQTKDTTTQLANEMSRAAREALNFVNNLGGGAGVSAAIGRVAGLRAELEARRGGASEVEVAMERARAQAMADPRTQAALQGPVGLAEETRRRIAEEVEAARLGAIAGQIQKEISDLLRPETGDTGGAGGARQEDYLSQLQKEAELKLRLIGLSDEQRRYEEIVAELMSRELPVEEKRIQAIIATEQALQQATNAEERRQDIMQAVTSNIETALMGLVEGTTSVEDAFKSMMRNIILEVYRQQVVKPFASAIGDFFFANGAVMRNGNVVPFADGGVVGGPTMFPMSSGRTGLMGEAGPEAIMPLKRTKGGKLGVVAEGGGTVSITQNFNIAANGDDSVKRIVQQQIPRIAEATKAAVADAKRRGGSYGRAFA